MFRYTLTLEPPENPLEELAFQGGKVLERQAPDGTWVEVEVEFGGEDWEGLHEAYHDVKEVCRRLLAEEAFERDAEHPGVQAYLAARRGLARSDKLLDDVNEWTKVYLEDFA